MANTVKARYEKYVEDRRPYLDRAQEASKLTIPSLVPDDGHTSNSTFETPWQSTGSRGVNNLAAKMLLALFPPNSPFFRMKVDEVTLAELEAGTRGDLEKGLTVYERVATDDIEDSKSRSSFYQGFRHLVVAGNVLLFNTKDGKVRMYPLSRYVVKRDAEGNVYEIIATDATVWGALSADFKEIAAQVGAAPGAEDDKEVTIYTVVKRMGNKWEVLQEIEGVIVPGSEGSYPLDANPWIPLRFTAIDGESYGRGLIEELYGDLSALDALSQAITEGSAASAIVRFLVDPNGVTEAADLNESDNGDFVNGREQDISSVQVNKFADLRVALEKTADLKQDLAYAFLMNSSVQRQAERVTAEEVRFMAQELEDALGGIYSVLGEELQLPLVTYRLNRLAAKGKLPKLPKEIKPKIITGLEALGRAAEHQRLRVFVGDMAQTFGPEVAAEYVVVDEYGKRSAAAMNVEPNGLVRSEEQVQQNRQQRARLEAETAAAAHAAKFDTPQE